MGLRMGCVGLTVLLTSWLEDGCARSDILTCAWPVVTPRFPLMTSAGAAVALEVINIRPTPMPKRAGIRKSELALRELRSAIVCFIRL